MPTISTSEPGSSKRKTGLIVGVVVAVTILGLIAVLTTLYWRPKKKMSEIDKGAILYSHIFIRIIQLDAMDRPTLGRMWVCSVGLYFTLLYFQFLFLLFGQIYWG